MRSDLAVEHFVANNDCSSGLKGLATGEVWYWRRRDCLLQCGCHIVKRPLRAGLHKGAAVRVVQVVSRKWRGEDL